MPPFQEIPDLTTEQFNKFAQVIHEWAGIHLKDHKVTLLSNRLRKRLRNLNLNNYDEYYSYLLNDKGSEMVHFLEVVTTNESYFWRTTQNYDALKTIVLPEVLKLYSKQELQIWSAGCSTGEEPYNLAIELIEAMRKVGFFNFKITATDISNRVVEFAKAGQYTGRKIEKIPPDILNRYFRSLPNDSAVFEVREDIKAKIDFKVENLFQSTPNGMHIIFCRNVMIYFQREEQTVLVERFYKALKPGGYLFIGHAESLQMLETNFQTVSTPLGILYRKEM
ncbi:MAG: protein-glutamate O-methyltransferase CheR [Leptonema sp. (in: Bacteria)]|nr:protein-glutamate O-methyltransferase CheR [Leptonema sp. (in: bacteria)]